MMCGVDSNGHVGSTREIDNETRRGQERGEGEGEEYIYVGPLGPEEENVNGKLMRDFLEQSQMLAVNTTDERASGKTWYGGKGGPLEWTTF